MVLNLQCLLRGKCLVLLIIIVEKQILLEFALIHVMPLQTGYDLRTENAINETLDKFDTEVGLKYLKVIHLNDSKDKLNSNRDRHEHISLGKIGLG